MKVQGKGSIRSREPDKPRSRCRKWQLRVTVGKDAGTGRLIRKSRSYAGTYSGAQKALREFIQEIESGTIIEGDCTLGDYYKEWHQLRIDSKEYSDRTLQGEDYKMRNVLKHLSKAKLSELCSKDFERMYVKFRNGETMSGKPMSGTSCANTHKTLITMLKAAEHDNLLTPGVISGIKVPKNDTKEKEALSNEDVARLLQKLNPEIPLEFMVMLCVMCGLRRSESLALTWSDIDKGAIKIDKALNEDGTIKPCPKSKASNRYVPMPIQVQDALIVRRATQQTVLGYSDEDTPIIDNFGQYYVPHSASSWWRKHRQKFGMSCTLHELRHTYTTMLITRDVDVKTVQSLLGHATPDVTLQVYSHVHDESLRKAAELLGHMFDPQSDPQNANSVQDVIR